MVRALLLVVVLSSGLLGCKQSEPAPEPQPQPEPAGPADPAPQPASDVFSLRFKNWTGTEVDDVIQTLEKSKDFADWNHRGQTGVYSVYEVRYTGKLITAAVRNALEDNRLNNRAEISLSGNDVNVIKTGR